MAVEAAFHIMPPLIAGAVIGLYEIVLVQRDVQVRLHKLSHGIHAFIFALVATFAVFNVPFVLNLIPQLANIPLIGNELVFRILIGLVTIIKIHGVSAAIKSTAASSVGMSETWFHSLLIGALITASPYVWPLLAPVLPSWMR